MQGSLNKEKKMDANPMKTFFLELLENEDEKKIINLLFDELDEDQLLEKILELDAQEEKKND